MSEYNFFSEGSPYLQHPLLTPERAVFEVDFLLRQMELPPAARILDVGCGFGRHTIELAKRGFRVTALDPSPAMISAARDHAAAARVTPDFQQVRAEDFRTTLSFDAAICLFTTLGQVTAEGQGGLDLLNAVHEALAEGAPLAVEIPQRKPTVNRLKTTDRFGNDRSYTKVSRQFNPQDNMLDERFEVVSPQRSQIYHLRYRLFSHGELKAMLRAAGFALRASFGDYAGKPLRQDDATMLVIAKAL